ncbi:MAG TPA: nuclear transport factor 2 family protein, partial [Caulobacteraceae bacterium]|nr:nuclear transport factor 2 family protein [Caulobacteraceae bacterium]
MTRIQLAGAAAAVLMAASLGACARPEAAKPAVDTGKIADAVKADEAQRYADVNAHDPAKVASHDAADAVSMFHGRPNAVGPDAIAASFKASLTDSPDLHVAASNQTVDVAASGDLAVFHATSVATFTDPKTKKPMTITSNSLAGYKPRADGTWKIEWSVVSNTA